MDQLDGKVEESINFSELLKLMKRDNEQDSERKEKVPNIKKKPNEISQSKSLRIFFLIFRIQGVKKGYPIYPK